jgi:streptogramin lyase
LFGKAVSGQSEYRLIVNGGEVVGTVDTGTEHDVHSGYNAPANTWTHVALTYDGSTLAIYINGSLANTAAVSGTLVDCGSCNSSQRSFTIGGRDDGFDFNGLIDEVEVFNTTLTAGEIQAIYFADAAGKCRTCDSALSGLVGWWPGDGNTKDIQNGNNGLLKNGATFAPGEVGKAFSFNGINGSVNVPKSPSLDVGNQVTVDFWMNGSASNTFSGSEGLVATDFYGFETEGSTLAFFVSTNSGSSFAVASTSVPPTGEWHHIAGTYDGATVDLYIDGVLQSSVGQSGSISPMAANSFLTIGSEDGRTFCGASCLGNRYFNGIIDEVEIFNRALSAAEIQTMFNAGGVGKCKPTCVSPPSGLIAWWPGDNTATDIQLGHNGTLQNGATFANGKVDRAFLFNGNNQGVDVGQFDPGSTFTIDAWINGTDYSGNGIIISNFDSTNGFLLQVDNPGILDGLVANGGSFSEYTTSANVIKTGVWQHVVVTYDANAFTPFTFYVDGAPVSANGGNSAGAPGVSSAHARIGNWATTNSNRFIGRIDEVEIFDRVLNPQEAADLYNAGSAGKCKTVRFYVSNNGNNTIEKFDINGVDLGTFADASSGVKGPTGVAFDASGNLFVGDRFAQNILKLDSMGNGSVFASGPSKGFEDAFGLGFNSIGNLYSPDDDLNIVFKFTPDGNGGPLASTHLNVPTNVAFDSSGLLYVVSAGDGTVQTFDPTSGTYQGQFAGGLLLPIGLVFDSSGQLYVSNSSTSIIERFDSAGNDLGNFANVTAASAIWGMIFDPEGNLYVADRNGSALYKFDPAGTQSTFASTPTANLSNPEFIAAQLLSPTATSIQFDKPSYSVNEIAGTITLTVTRNGDLSGPSIVHYATADGSATSPDDYTATSGDLPFAATDTSMTFQAPIIIDDDTNPVSEPALKTFNS